MDAITLALAKQYADKKVDNIVYDGYKTMKLNGEQGVQAPFSELIGLKIVDKAKGRRFLAAPKERFDGNDGIIFYLNEGSFTSGGTAHTSIEYGCFDGMLDKPCLTITSHAMAMYCPSYFHDKTQTILCYAFEETHDTLGLGVTMTQGWYAANGATFAVEPFDPKEYPFIMTTKKLEEGASDYSLDYLCDMFPVVEEISYTVGAENIYREENVTQIGYSKIGDITITEIEQGLFTVIGILFQGSVIMNNNDRNAFVRSIDGLEDRTVTITYPVVKQLDPKFVPNLIPAVVLETATVDNDAAFLSDAEVEALAAVFDKHDLVNVTRTGVNGTVVSSLFQKNVNTDGTFYTSIYMDMTQGLPDFRIALLVVGPEESTGTMMGVLSDMRSSILQIE